MKFLAASIMIASAAAIICLTTGGEVAAGGIIAIALATMMYGGNTPVASISIHLEGGDQSVEPDPEEIE